MADTYLRFFAMPGMFAILLFGFFPLLVIAFRGGHVFAAAAVVLFATLFALSGLVVASRLATLVGTLVQAGAVVWLLLLGDTGWAFALVLLGALVIDVVAIGAVFAPDAADVASEAASAEAPLPVSARGAALVAMGLVALTSLALLVSSTLGGGLGGNLHAGLTGTVGLVGAGLCLFALWVRNDALAALAGAAQGVAALVLLAWFGDDSVYGLLHLVTAIAAVLTVVAALRPGASPAGPASAR
jgi:hypothetical protein